MAELPEIPKGVELEDFVSGLLHEAGYFVEHSIVEHGPQDVLEVDIVATEYDEGYPRRQLFEIKSGKDWGFSDVFKVIGWKTYLGFGNDERALLLATLAAPEKLTHIKFYKEKCEELGIELLFEQDHNQISDRLKELDIVDSTIDPQQHSFWRFSLWLERQFLSMLSRQRKQRLNDGSNEIWKYLDQINNGTFFSSSVQLAANNLYLAHNDHPQLAKAVAAASVSGSYSDWDGESGGTELMASLNSCEYSAIQIALYVQLRAKISIFKCAVDYAALEEAGKLAPGRTMTLGNVTVTLDAMPSSFMQAVEHLKIFDHYRKYPALIQSFCWKWGGFLLTDREKKGVKGG